MAALAKVVHDIPGRLRFRVPGLRGAPFALEQVRDRLARFNGVDRVEGNAMTGSLLILHHTTAEEIIRRAEAEDLLGFRTFEEEVVPNIRERVASVAGDVDERIRTATRGALDLQAIAAMVLTIGAARQIRRQVFWPAAATLLQYATSFVRGASTRVPAAGAAAPRSSTVTGGPRMVRIN